MKLVPANAKHLISLYTAEQKKHVKPLIVEDLEKLKSKTKIEDAIIKMGIRNIIVAPLYYEKELIGVIEVGSHEIRATSIH